MVESSKILTVSYGTFSCTLEGFDDSFSTMKAIAEYFRDLAQEDRYFGAEPPVPDTQMLASIAEKEISRRVEARADESGIVLRAADAAAVAAPVMPPVATPPSQDAVADATPAVEDIVESSPAATADVEEDVAGQEAEDDTSSTLVASSPATPVVEDAMDGVEEMDVTAPETSFDDMDASTIAEAPAHSDADSVAAKLQRIRAVVGSSDDTVQADVAEDVAEEEDVAEDAPSTADLIADITADDSLEFDDENDFAAEDEAADVVAEDEAEDIVAEEELEDVVTEDEVVAEAEDEADITEDVAEDDAEEVVEAEAEAEAEEVAEDEAEEETAEAEDDVEETADVAEEEVVAEEPKTNFRARILRVAKKATGAPADVADVAADEAEEVAEDVSEVVAEKDEGDSVFEDIAFNESDEVSTEATLSDEDEAELMADLAEVEAEVADASDDAPAAASGRDALPDADEAEMSRIMDTANEQLSEPEGSRRRSAIAQLKAAVAATEAARQLGDDSGTAASKENAFRDDLNDAVKPRAAGDLPRTEERVERSRPAPLKLVASQRVDGEEEAEEQPMRVEAPAAASFTDFAAEMGATDLPDLLEAAAAYTAYIEGVEDFSRPQIMKKVQASATQEFSREDGLRSFGTLLRQGRISKVRNGRFQVSDQTRFKPEKKAG